MTRLFQSADMMLPGHSTGVTAARAAPDVLGSIRILLVEDDALIARFLGDVLLDLGHAVSAVARTEREAVDAAARLAPDMIIVDVILAYGDGIAALRTIQRAGYVPHLYMTGGDTSRVPAESTILRKPFGLDELVRALASALDPARIAAASME